MNAIRYIYLLIINLIFFVSTIVCAANFKTVKTSTDDSIYSLESITLGGLSQKILITGNDTSKPILLFIHGGPGFTEMGMLMKYNQDLNNHFILVSWDQRGTGLSYNPGIPKATMTMTQIIADAHELIDSLKKRFHRQKIFLVGHSFGTYVATTLASEYPQDFYAYIGIGQIVNMMENEKLSLTYTIEMAKKTHNKKALYELTNLAKHYPSKISYLPDLYLQRKWLAYFGGAVWQHHDFSSIYKGLGTINNSVYNAKQSEAGNNFSMNTLWNQVLTINLTETVPMLKVPVYFLLGKHDYNTPYPLAQKYFKDLKAPYKKMILFKNSAHLPCFEEPKKFDMIMANIAKIANHGKTDSPK